MNPPRSVPLSRHLLFWSLAALGCTVDLWSKHWMFARPELLAGDVWWLWRDHLGFQLSLNEGALFGVGQGKVWIFALFAATASLAIPIWLFVLGAARDRALTATLGCIMGGVLGNLYDRVGLPGLDWGIQRPDRQGEPVYAVRDFILAAWRWDADWQNRIVWPNFNVADSLLVCGAATLLLLSLRRPPNEVSAIETILKAEKSMQ